MNYNLKKKFQLKFCFSDIACFDKCYIDNKVQIPNGEKCRHSGFQEEICSVNAIIYLLLEV